MYIMHNYCLHSRNLCPRWACGYPLLCLEKNVYIYCPQRVETSRITTASIAGTSARARPAVCLRSPPIKDLVLKTCGCNRTALSKRTCDKYIASKF